MADWYRRKTWTVTDEEEFFAKFNRTRDYNRAQYLRAQAIELIETKEENLLIVAETLLNKILKDYPDNKIEKSQTYNQLGQIYKLRENYDKALNYFKKSLDFEKEYPQVKTSSYLGFSETVVLAEKTELYNNVEEILIAEINNELLKFPVQNYVMYSVLCVIAEHKGNSKQAELYADLARANATAEVNTLWNPKKKKYGVVKERIIWLDKIIDKKR